MGMGGGSGAGRVRCNRRADGRGAALARGARDPGPARRALVAQRAGAARRRPRFVPVLILGWLAIASRGAPPGTLVVLAAAAALAALSWRDDRHGLAVTLRLGAHGLAVLAGLASVHGLVFQGALPPLLDRAAAAVLWLWFVELYNFMDGIDGIAGIETTMLGGGIALVLGAAGQAGDGTAALALAAAAAGLGFLRWNWHPARIFLGDVGSVPLGYLLGWLLLLVAAKGLWAPALILPLYYLADASITLARRILRRALFWQAHREHFYQRALGRDGDHAAVARMVLLCDAALVALALLALAAPVSAVILGRRRGRPAARSAVAQGGAWLGAACSCLAAAASSAAPSRRVSPRAARGSSPRYAHPSRSAPASSCAPRVR